MTLLRKVLFGLAFIGFLVFIGCATSNGYAKFYNPVGPARTIVTAPQKPQLLRGGADVEEDIRTAMENGFRYVGYSNFNGPSEDPEHAREFGQKIGADLVVVYTKYTNTSEGSIPLILPNAPTTSTTTSSGSIYGTGGSATYTGTATTTTPGGYSTHNIPYHVDRFDQGAMYFVKAKKAILGLFYRDLNSDERSRLQRNRGVAVIAVRKGSPAFRADFLHGDLVLELQGEPVDDWQGFDKMLAAHAGRRVKIKFVRGSDPHEVDVQLDPEP